MGVLNKIKELMMDDIRLKKKPAMEINIDRKKFIPCVSILTSTHPEYKKYKYLFISYNTRNGIKVLDLVKAKKFDEDKNEFDFDWINTVSISVNDIDKYEFKEYIRIDIN